MALNTQHVVIQTNQKPILFFHIWKSSKILRLTMSSINSDNRRIARQVSRRTIYMPPRIEIPVVVPCHVTLRGSLAYPINLNRYYIYFNKALRASLTPILFSFHFSPALRLLLLFIRIILRNLFCFYFISTLSLSLSL